MELRGEWPGTLKCNHIVFVYIQDKLPKTVNEYGMKCMNATVDTKENAVELGLHELYSKIQRAVEVHSLKDNSKGHISLVIDDLSVLEIVTHGSTDLVLDFLHYCITLTSELDCSLVILNHGDIYQDTEAAIFLSHLIYLADFIIKAEPLATGIAADVHGQLTVVKKGIFNNGNYISAAINFHFQVKENGVECFLPGSRC
ncbi:hypothetical protein HPP92_011722 [Vanilla planifolia]|uniref:Elongator complex protein 6 n=1 Tax=Vanilla planifolia TaxID=51239 RepID=A0A835R717_VANPL|nr:hypothetical protein HPP92_012075 [Vanilla planifolia]KAG0483638.1 hypothetical protein HPP92_011722 [Vanilla planifolia]